MQLTNDGSLLWSTLIVTHINFRQVYRGGHGPIQTVYQSLIGF